MPIMKTPRSMTADEALAEEVRKHPCLYNKADIGYNQTDPVRNAWKAVEETLGYEEGTACKLFYTLKKRFSRIRVTQKKASRSGSSDVAHADRHLKEYEFLSWLIPFIRHRKMKEDLSVRSSIDGNNVPINVDEIVVDEDNGDEDNPSMNTSVSGKNKRGGTSFTVSKAKVRKQNIEGEKVIREPMINMAKAMEQRLQRNATSHNNQEQDFGRMIASELSNLPEYFKIQAKHEINNIVFKYQMQAQQAIFHPYASSNVSTAPASKHL